MTNQELFKQLNANITWFDRHIWFPIYRKFVSPISNLYYDVIHLPSNIKKWGNFVIKDRDWEFNYTLEALEIKCRAQANNIKLYHMGENYKEYHDKAIACADALKRIREDKYIEYEKIPDNCDWDELQKKEQEAFDNDIAIICESLKSIRGWWT